MISTVKWKVGLSTCNKNHFDAALYQSFAEAGITHAEVSISRDDLPTADLQAVVQAAAAAGVTLWSFHLPFGQAYDISRMDEAGREAALEQNKVLIQKAVDMGIHLMVIHPSYEPIADEDRAVRLSLARESLATLAAYAQGLGVTIAVEDLPRTCLGRDIEELRYLISGHAALRVCLDTNHLLTDRTEDAVYALADKIATLHVSDYDFLNERHWLPGEGDNRWDKILDALEAVGYHGPFLYELGYEAPATIQRRTLTPKDFYENFLAVVEGRPIPLKGILCPEAFINYYQVPQVKN